ncbi:uncharacterized protein BDR25DRAFT_350687 [Lindgomyces ingoldianus]|uniref:Uncharacterized protein n=1 Tax=Lindgomyces ingoldianus TaxID=673940 RepID=A0ACB6R7R3_9PLEO|nr:uncharacterized protein BDR25DRAFT_350687 [Lindgomyces ingoldianus]KAF2475299.1 hypothetical protein BDR25DRAFT_350687 [Lindgomyces ingoldianus]
MQTSAATTQYRRPKRCRKGQRGNLDGKNIGITPTDDDLGLAVAIGEVEAASSSKGRRRCWRRVAPVPGVRRRGSVPSGCIEIELVYPWRPDQPARRPFPSRATTHHSLLGTEDARRRDRIPCAPLHLRASQGVLNSMSDVKGRHNEARRPARHVLGAGRHGASTVARLPLVVLVNHCSIRTHRGSVLRVPLRGADHLGVSKPVGLMLQNLDSARLLGLLCDSIRHAIRCAPAKSRRNSLLQGCSSPCRTPLEQLQGFVALRPARARKTANCVLWAYVPIYGGKNHRLKGGTESHPALLLGAGMFLSRRRLSWMNANPIAPDALVGPSCPLIDCLYKRQTALAPELGPCSRLSAIWLNTILTPLSSSFGMNNVNGALTRELL